MGTHAVNVEPTETLEFSDFVELLERGEAALQEHTADEGTGRCSVCGVQWPCETWTAVHAGMRPFIDLYERIMTAERRREGRGWAK